MADITLTATSRSNLLSLNQTTDLANRTQTRLATGLKVSSAIDDAAAYFASKTLSDRANDFSARKDEINQGISTLKAAVNATESVDKLLKQIKGVAISAKTADDAGKADLGAQFADLLDQVNSLLGDASYQGTNLVNSTTQSLTVRFSEVTTAQLDVSSRDLRAGALFTAAANASDVGSDIAAALIGGSSFTAIATSALITTINDITSAVDSAVSTVRATASNLGSNITLLQTRADFTSNYVNSLTEGADKLRLADLNEEGANLVALQTRQQLALQALNFAGQSEQNVLSLFR
ncbi:flagellin [Oleomonas cavernae]|uniref:Flagellin n=1 Tax=Oleomonas cavernae TaxID=2320859 RepID=A0A418WAM7_9PROT|nr:flagellin [Oleomonas cavernae]RJF87097.1 flagellin [Oleomonas cavernae]